MFTLKGFVTLFGLFSILSFSTSRGVIARYLLQLSPSQFYEKKISFKQYFSILNPLLVCRSPRPRACQSADFCSVVLP